MSQIIKQGYGAANLIVTSGYGFNAEEPPTPPTPTPTYTITITAEEHGSTSPAAGTHVYEEGETAVLTATADSGWGFLHWLKNSETIITANPYTFTVTQGATFDPVFQVNQTPEEPEQPEPQPDYSLTPASMFTALVAKVEAQGVSCNVTHKKLVLDQQDGVTGQFVEAYDESTVKAVFCPDGAANEGFESARASQVHAVVYVYLPVYEGDDLIDAAGRAWHVLTSEPVTFGDVYAFRRLGVVYSNAARSEGEYHPPPSALKRLTVHVLDWSIPVYNLCNLTIQVYDFNLVGNNGFPYTYPFTLA